MKAFIIAFLTLVIAASASAQNTDLPSPTANLQTLPSGSYVIAMDNTNQVNNSGVFNYKAYGLIVTLLNNSKAVKWVIKAGKIKDGIDFTVNATRIKPTYVSAASYDFKAGPFVIFAQDTTGIAAIIDFYNLLILNANDKVKVYRTNADVSVDIRYNLTGFVPKAAILTDGGNAAIHVSYMTNCNIPGENYLTASSPDLLTDCFTFASEPHNDKTGDNMDLAVSVAKRFVEFGGNFLAQCEAVASYENNVLGYFQTTTGITSVNSNVGTSITYPNPDLAYSQFEGNFDISKGGSLRNWRINAAWSHSGHKHSRSVTDTTVTGSSVAKLKSGMGGLMFYLGNHTFADQLSQITCVNGLRMYMNAFLTPVSIGQNCTIGQRYMDPLSTQVFSFAGNQNNGIATMNWEVSENETIRNFELERSLDGSNFSSSTMIPVNVSRGNSSYRYNEQMSNEALYYRLKITEKHGAVKYSKTILLYSLQQSKDLKVVGNPVSDDRLGLQFHSDMTSPVSIRISDMSGRLQYSRGLQAMQGTNNAVILLPSVLKKGIYFVEINSGSARLTAKFVKL